MTRPRALANAGVSKERGRGGGGSRHRAMAAERHDPGAHDHRRRERHGNAAQPRPRRLTGGGRRNAPPPVERRRPDEARRQAETAATNRLEPSVQRGRTAAEGVSGDLILRTKQTHRPGSVSQPGRRGDPLPAAPYSRNQRRGMMSARPPRPRRESTIRTSAAFRWRKRRERRRPPAGRSPRAPTPSRMPHDERIGPTLE